MMLPECRGVALVLQNNDGFPATLLFSHFRIFPNVDITRQDRMATDEMCSPSARGALILLKQSSASQTCEDERQQDTSAAAAWQGERGNTKQTAQYQPRGRGTQKPALQKSNAGGNCFWSNF